VYLFESSEFWCSLNHTVPDLPICHYYVALTAKDNDNSWSVNSRSVSGLQLMIFFRMPCTELQVRSALQFTVITNRQADTVNSNQTAGRIT